MFSGIFPTFLNSDNPGPWGERGGNKGGTRRGGNDKRKQDPFGGRRPEQPDIEDLLRNAQDRMRAMMGGGGGGGSNGLSNFSGGLLRLVLMVIVFLWLLSGFYRVEQDEQGVVLRFGKYAQTTEPGLRYHWPYPIETVAKPKVTRENIVEVGFKGGQMMSSSLFGQRFANSPATATSGAALMDIPQESLMLTGDENIVDLDFTVRWKISDAREYLFNVVNVEDMLKNVSESAMREIIGRHRIDDALTDNKTMIQQEVKELIQEIVQSYRAGVEITGAELQQVNPPADVISAFRDVQAARADAEKMQNEAVGYANDIIPRARGEVAQIIQDAEAYKASKVAEANGAGQRFISQLEEYKKAKEVTTRRLYLETMENVLSKARKVIVGSETGKNILPYLPLGRIQQGGAR